jgi:hypothetical protein
MFEISIENDLLPDLIEVIEAARNDGGGELLPETLKRRLVAAGIYVGRVKDWD